MVGISYHVTFADPHNVALCWEFEEAPKVKMRRNFTFTGLPEEFFFFCLPVFINSAQSLSFENIAMPQNS